MISLSAKLNWPTIFTKEIPEYFITIKLTYTHQKFCQLTVYLTQRLVLPELGDQNGKSSILSGMTTYDRTEASRKLRPRQQRFWYSAHGYLSASNIPSELDAIQWHYHFLLFALQLDILGRPCSRGKFLKLQGGFGNSQRATWMLSNRVRWFILDLCNTIDGTSIWITRTRPNYRVFPEKCDACNC